MEDMKIRKVKCKEDYIELCLDGDKPYSDEHFFNKTFFYNGKEYLFKKEDGIYFISTNRRYLQSMNHYHNYIMDMDEINFNKHFEEIKK